MIKIILNFFIIFFIRLDHIDSPTHHKRIHRMDKRGIQSLLSLIIRRSDNHLNLSTELLRLKI